MKNVYFLVKRAFDILLGTFALIVLSPLFLPIMAGLRLTGEGEVFYRQKRVGYRNKMFGIWKFATMLKNSPNMGTGSLTLRDDPRVTPLGKYLRKSKINELPQLINLVIGDMTLVGPRPQMQVDFEAYSLSVQSCIYNLKPGITGIGSVIFRDEEKIISSSGMPPRECYDTLIAPYKGELELWYQQHQSFITDLKIILLTALVVLFTESKLPYRWFPDLPPSDFF
jgi:lipopolysaccharide/colanic/teichoic acid biosynthesis glycosyltransferase